MDEFNNEQSNQQENNMYGEQPQVMQYGSDMGQQPKESKGLSIAALVCVIISLLSWCINGWLVLILSIAAIVMGAIGRKKGAKGMGTAGMVCGIIALVIFALLILLGFVIGIAAVGALGGF